MRYTSVFVGHTSGVSGVAASDDGRIVVSTSFDETTRVWDPSEQTNEAEVGPHVVMQDRSFDREIAMTPDGKIVVIGDERGNIRVLSTTTGKILQRTFKSDLWIISSIVVAPDASEVIFGTTDGFVRVLNVSTGMMTDSMSDHGVYTPINVVAPTGRSVAIVNGETTAHVRGRFTSKTISRLEGPHERLTAVALTPDGLTVVAGTKRGGVHVWTADTGKMVRAYRGPNEEVTSVATTPDARTVVTGYVRRVCVWNTVTGTFRTLTGVRGMVESLVITPNGKMVVAAGSRDDNVYVYEGHKEFEMATLAMLGRPLTRLDPKNHMMWRDGDHAVWTRVCGFLIWT